MIIGTAAALLSSSGAAMAHQQERKLDTRGTQAVTAPMPAGTTNIVENEKGKLGSQFSAEPEGGSQRQGLPPKRENIDLISKLTFKGGPGGDIVPGQIADIAVHKNTAYLMSWSQPQTTCDRGGVFIVDISNPAAPQERGFIRALPNSYHGEGAHAISVDTPTFKGDLLAVNNEPCPGKRGAGGFDLYDVTNPAAPQILIQGAGDRGGEGTLTGTREFANSAHSAFMWTNDGRVFLGSVDNAEVHDVDIFDITNPRTPQPVGEFDLLELAAQQGVDIFDEGANGGDVFHHDFVVKEINGRQTMLASYWDAGYVKLDVEDPANPRYVGDTTFNGRDPLTGFTPPEGNAHQGEFSADNRFFLGADEDFSPFRLVDFQVTTGPFAGPRDEAGEFGFTRQIARLDDGTLNGPTIFGGYGCNASEPIPPASNLTVAEGEEKIVVLERGPIRTDDPKEDYSACTFQEKADNAGKAGYDAVAIANHHNGSGYGKTPDAALCGSGNGSSVRGICIGHRLMHQLFEKEPAYDKQYVEEKEPAVGATGAKISTRSAFDGWGFTHVFENSSGKMRELGAYAVDEALDRRFAFDFGDLSVHEFATDPDVPLGYVAYYHAGARVVSFDQNGLRETGAFIDDRGNNFWGVEQFTDASGNRLMAMSDRDFGLYILKYTGPGAFQPARATPADPGSPGSPGSPATPATPPAQRGPCEAPEAGASRAKIRGLSLGLKRKGGFRRNQTGIVPESKQRSARGKSLVVTSRGRMTPPRGRPVCGGKVLVRIKSGKLTLSSRTVVLRANGTFVSKAKLTLPRRITEKRLSVKARFLGNKAYLPKSARTGKVKALR